MYKYRKELKNKIGTSAAAIAQYVSAFAIWHSGEALCEVCNSAIVHSNE